MDRGFLFADGVYEVSAVLEAKLVDNPAHLARLGRSLAEICIENPYDTIEWAAIQKQLIEQNELNEGVVYIQVTRGVAERDFAIPAGARPTALAFTQSKNLVKSPVAENGARIVTVPDQRWARRDIKSIGLLPQVLAKQAALSQGCDEAWMIEDGAITEGASSTAFIISKADILLTRQLSPSILPGVTRMSLLQLAREHKLEIEERPFSLEEALNAKEAFYSSASSLITPVISIDGQIVGDGRPSEHTRRLRELYIEYAQKG